MARIVVLGMLGLLLVASACLADSAPPAAYVPQFSTVKTEFGHYWVLDHGQRIALLGCEQQETSGFEIGLFRQFPGQPLDEKQFKDSDCLDFVGLPGLRLNTNWIGAPAMKGVPGSMKLDNSDPTQMIIRLAWKKNAIDSGTQTLRLVYDPELRRYVVHVEDDLQLAEPGGGEYCNFYVNGVGDFRPDVGRYKQLVYRDADDGNKLKAHYLSTIVRKPMEHLIHLSPTQGLTGYAAEKEGSPVVFIEESTPDTREGICPCWYDSHLTWDPIEHIKGPRSPDVAGPPYHYHAKLKAYWNSAAETDALLAGAEKVSLLPFADKFKTAMPFDMGAVASFEHYADFESGDVKHVYLPLKLNKAGGTSLDTTVAHSGKNSICFVSKTDKGIQQAPIGPELMVTPGRQVKISVWVKTANVTGDGFYLESGFERWTPTGHEEFGSGYRSAKLTGTHDWTLLEIPMPITPPKAEYLSTKGGRILFRLGGQGTAWVDDLVFSEEDAAGNAAHH